MGKEIITWDNAKQISEDLLKEITTVNEGFLSDINNKQGLYIVAYEGNELGLGFWGANEPKIIFVGKAKSDSSRHFQSGTTGASTLRRSLGALLQNQLELIPIPRSQDKADNDRYDNYAFDEASEVKLTNWILENFQVAFLPYDKENIDDLRKALIEYNIPIFNFQNNPANKYGAQIKSWRKKCAEEAKAMHNAQCTMHN